MTINSPYSLDGSGYYARYTSRPEGVFQSPYASSLQAQSVLSNAYGKLVFGRTLPSLDELLTQTSGLNPSSQGAYSLVTQLNGLFGQFGGWVGKLRAYQFSLINAVRYLNNVALGLFSASRQVDPRSPQGKTIGQRIQQLASIEQNINNQFQLAVQFDPTRGGTVPV